MRGGGGAGAGQGRAPPTHTPPSPPTCPQHSLASFPDAVSIPPTSLLTVPCDVLVPAAIGGVISEANAHELQCKVGGG